MLTEMNPRDGKMSRAWNLYTTFIGRSQGYRGSVMSYADFCGRHSANYASRPGCELARLPASALCKDCVRVWAKPQSRSAKRGRDCVGL